MPLLTWKLGLCQMGVGDGADLGFGLNSPFDIVFWCLWGCYPITLCLCFPPAIQDGETSRAWERFKMEESQLLGKMKYFFKYESYHYLLQEKVILEARWKGDKLGPEYDFHCTSCSVTWLRVASWSRLSSVNISL